MAEENEVQIVEQVQEQLPIAVAQAPEETDDAKPKRRRRAPREADGEEVRSTVDEVETDGQPATREDGSAAEESKEQSSDCY